MLNNTLSSFNLQFIGCYSNPNIIFSFRNDTLLDKEWCRAGTISHIDGIKTIESKNEHQEFFEKTKENGIILQIAQIIFQLLYFHYLEGKMNSFEWQFHHSFHDI